MGEPHRVADPQSIIERDTAKFYRDVMKVLDRAEVPYLLGGSFAYACYTGIVGRTKDLDLFVRPSDVDAAIRTLAGAGYETEMHAPTWIAKARRGDDLVDIIFGAGNDLARVDEEWFEHARRSTFMDREVRVIPIEEMIWSKAFVMERHRFDGHDVLHLMRAADAKLDGERLLRRFGHHWRVLLALVVLFDYVYPSLRDRIPSELRDELLRRAGQEATEEPLDGDLCYGRFLSKQQYRTDIEDNGLIDARDVPLS